MEIQSPFNSRSVFFSSTTSSSLKPKLLNYKPQTPKNPSFAHPLSIKPNPHRKYVKKTISFDEKYHATEQTVSLIKKLEMGNVRPLQLLQDYGDWDKTQFWAVITFLKHASRFHEIIEVFDAWTKLQPSRINELNYNKIISLLGEAGMIGEAAEELQSMRNHGLRLDTEAYNSLIQGFAQKGMFDDALRYLGEMGDMNVNPDTKTYDGLIKAYGKFQMYDEMVNCLKMMEASGCSPDYITYNLLIRELSKGRLLNRMEKMCRTVNSKNMGLQSITLVTMLEAYADVGILDKMERLYMKVRNSKTLLTERLIRKIARVFIENHMFSRLIDLGNDVALRTGRTDLFWFLHLLAQACLLSKKGMNTVIGKMEEAGVSWNVTVANIFLMAYMKMKDFKQLSAILSELAYRHVTPDIVTFGVLYDGYNAGFDWSSTLKLWRKYSYLDNSVEVNTDPLVFTAFGKGIFLSAVEELNSLLEPKTREEKMWTYKGLVDLVLQHHGLIPELSKTTQSDQIK